MPTRLGKLQSFRVEADLSHSLGIKKFYCQGKIEASWLLTGMNLEII